ncbi:MAG: hypothetical protein IT205_04960 [Fimbriimonadaceae bacterium]|nr:hypothetical protein [Fimbriimonadaceae bacterium]
MIGYRADEPRERYNLRVRSIFAYRVRRWFQALLQLDGKERWNILLKNFGAVTLLQGVTWYYKVHIPLSTKTPGPVPPTPSDSPFYIALGIASFVGALLLSFNEADAKRTSMVGAYRARYYELMDGLANHALHLLNKADDNDWRCSIFQVAHDKLWLVGRDSANSNYNSRGTRAYPLSGFVGVAFRESGMKSSKLPDIGRDAADYFSKHARCGYTEEMVTALTMKSRSYYCRGLRAKNDAHAIGVIVVETLDHSVNRNVVHKVENEVLGGQFYEVLCATVKSFSELFSPTEDELKNAGLLK